jgi:hypothetical protein
MPGKRVQLDEESWAALDLLARDRMMTFQELADEAFADVLKNMAGQSTCAQRCARARGPQTLGPFPHRRDVPRLGRLPQRLSRMGKAAGF